MGDIDRNQLQPKNTNNKHKALQGNNTARNEDIQNGDAQMKHFLSINTHKEKNW